MAHVWDWKDVVLLTGFPSVMSGMIIPFAIHILNWKSISPETDTINHFFAYALLLISVYGICTAIWTGLKITNRIALQNKTDKAQWEIS